MMVLDASALVAFALQEPGADVVETALPTGLISTANYAETLTRLARFGADIDELIKSIGATGLTLVDVTSAHAITAARLYSATKSAGLSLGDRLCLALALEQGRPALTAERSWAHLAHGATIVLIR
jgi:PIN domain nuclease of toxin-antitoxin system